MGSRPTSPTDSFPTGREHRVPLSRQALAVAKTAAGDAEASFLFPGMKRDKPLSNMAMSKVLKRLDMDATVHGFRSSFRDWVAEQTSFPNEVAEAALAHTIRNAAEAAYHRGDLLDKRREMMQAWADYCYSQVTD